MKPNKTKNYLNTYIYIYIHARETNLFCFASNKENNLILKDKFVQIYLYVFLINEKFEDSFFSTQYL